MLLILFLGKFKDINVKSKFKGEIVKRKALIIGSTAVDVIIEIDRLPKTGDDINTKSKVLNVGGCAYNVASMLSYLSKDFDLISPVGSGYFGDFVNKTLASNGFSTPLARTREENGCCYCFVENNGERSFVCHRGAEYVFKDEFFEELDPSEYEVIYFCGLDVATDSDVEVNSSVDADSGIAVNLNLGVDSCVDVGSNVRVNSGIEIDTDDPIVRFLKRTHKTCGSQHPTVFFAPSPQIHLIPDEILNQIFALNPIMHLNETEYSVLSKKLGSAEAILKMTKAPIIITQGSNGASIIMPTKDGITKVHIPAKPVENVVDTIGAGDAHAGAVIACMIEGKSLSESVAFANAMSAKVVETKGSTLQK